LLRSTTGKRENVEGDDDIFLPTKLAEMNVFEIGAIEILKFEVGRFLSHLQLRRIGGGLGETPRSAAAKDDGGHQGWQKQFTKMVHGVYLIFEEIA